MTDSTDVVIGSTVIFTGYTDLPEGEIELLVAGIRYPVVGLAGIGEYILENTTGGRETVFLEEIDVTTVAEPISIKSPPKAPAKTKAPAKAPAKVKAPAKTKTKPKAEAKAKVLPAVEPKKIVATAYSTPGIEDSEAVTKLLAGTDALEAAKALALQAEETFYSLGGVLAHVYNEGLYKTLEDASGNVAYSGTKGFGNYMLTELNIQYRKGMYLIEIYTVCRQLGISEAEVAKIGWSKMREIVKTLREHPEDREDLLTRALGTRESLVDHVKRTYVSAEVEGEKRVLKTRLSFNLFGEDAPTVQRALEAARNLIGTEATPEAALTLIAAEWSQLTESMEVSLDEALRAVSARYGVSVAVVTADEADSSEVEVLVLAEATA